MFRSGAVLLVLFAFGYNSPFIGGTRTAFDVINVSTNYNALDFLELVVNSTETIYSQIEDHSTERLLLSLKGKRAGINVKNLNFSVSIVKESAEKLLSLASDLRRKIQLIETEKNLRSIAARLFSGGNQTSVNKWLESKSNEFTESLASLAVLYSDLSKNFEHHLSNIGVIKRRLAVSLTYPDEGDDNHSDSESNICRNGMFVCENGARNLTCVKYCNGHSECGDGSDEPIGCGNLFGRNCPSFRCDDGECIDIRNRCTSNSYCNDRSHLHYCSSH